MTMQPTIEKFTDGKGKEAWRWTFGFSGFDSQLEAQDHVHCFVRDLEKDSLEQLLKGAIGTVGFRDSIGLQLRGTEGHSRDRHKLDAIGQILEDFLLSRIAVRSFRELQKLFENSKKVL